MSGDTNRFGGGNANSDYVPMSEIEQEVISRIVESQTVRVRVHGFGLKDITPKRVTYGDKRVQVLFKVEFASPIVPTRYPVLDLELVAEGLSLIRKPYPSILPDGQGIMIGDGVILELAWDIAIDHIDPAVVKAIKPMAMGLTSRRLDKDTKERTLTGNLILTPENRAAIFNLDTVEAKTRRDDVKQLDLLLR